MGGVWASAEYEAWISVREVDHGVVVRSSVDSNGHLPAMTVAEARSLAAQIMEAARRHEIRQSAVKK